MRRLYMFSVFGVAYARYALSLVLRMPSVVLLMVFLLSTIAATGIRWDGFPLRAVPLSGASTPQQYFPFLTYLVEKYGDQALAEQLVATFPSTKDKQTGNILIHPENAVRTQQEFWSSVAANQPTAREVLIGLAATAYQLYEDQQAASYTKTAYAVEPSDPRILKLLDTLEITY